MLFRRPYIYLCCVDKGLSQLLLTASLKQNQRWKATSDLKFWEIFLKEILFCNSNTMVPHRTKGSSKNISVMTSVLWLYKFEWEALSCRAGPVLCNKQCSWEGYCEDLIYCWRLSCSCHHSEIVIPCIPLPPPPLPAMYKWTCVAFFLYVCLSCVYACLCCQLVMENVLGLLAHLVPEEILLKWTPLVLIDWGQLQQTCT